MSPIQIVKKRVVSKSKTQLNYAPGTLEKTPEIDLYDAMAEDFGYYKIGNRYVKKWFSC